jgi:hypothetical protein
MANPGAHPWPPNGARSPRVVAGDLKLNPDVPISIVYQK